MICAGWTRSHGTGPGLLIAEGVLHYLSEAEVKALLNVVVAHFPGGRMLFDICNPWIVKRAGTNVGGRVEPTNGVSMIPRTSSSLNQNLN